MENGPPTELSLQQEEATQDWVYKQSQHAQDIGDGTQDRGHFLSPTDEAFKKEKYDSGVELGASSPEVNEPRKMITGMGLKGHRVSRVSADYRQDEPAADTGVSRLYEWESDQESAEDIGEDSIRSIQQGLVDVSLSSAGEESSDDLTSSGIEHILNQSLRPEEKHIGDTDHSFAPEVAFDSRLLSTVPQDQGVCHVSRAESESADSQKTDAWADLGNPKVPCRVPSLSRPKSSPKSSPKRGDRVREVRLGSTHSQESEGLAIIIDVDGEERVISAAEEKQRQLDLQNAVMEKMSTGVITAAEDKQRQLQLQRAVMEKMSSGVIGTASSASAGGHQEKTVGASDYSLWPSMRTEGVTPLSPGLQMGSRLEGPKSPRLFPNVDQDTTQKKKNGLRRKFSVLGLAKKKPVTVTASFG